MPINDIIKKLPKEYQEWGRLYSSALIEMSMEEGIEWITLVMTGEHITAYKSLVRRMTTDQLVDAQEKKNAELMLINKRSANQKAMVKAMVEDAVKIGFLIFKAAALAL